MPPAWIKKREKEDFPLKPQKYHPSGEDEVFLTEYLATFAANAATELARLAAAMAPTPASFDAEALVAQAMAIQRASLIAPEAKRRELLASATPMQVYLLEDALKKQFSGAEAVARLKPVTEAKERTREFLDARLFDSMGNKDEQQLCAVEVESGRPRPTLPCDHETAFRWGLSAKNDIPWAVLEQACADYFCLESARKNLDYAAKNLLLESAETALRSTGASASERAGHQATIQEIACLRTYDEKFRPGASPPAWMNNGLLESWKDSCRSPCMLSMIVRCFRAFWQKYGADCERKWRAVQAKQSAAAKETNSKRNPQYWTDESILKLAQQFTAKHRPAQRTADNARAFSIPGRDATDCGEILGAFIAVKALTLEAAAASLKTTLSHAEWRAVEETARGSSAGTAKRRKSGTFRKSHKGISVKDETLLECLKMMWARK